MYKPGRILLGSLETCGPQGLMEIQQTGGDVAANQWSVRNFKIGVLLVATAFLCGLVGLASAAGASDQQPEQADLAEVPVTEAALNAATDPVELPETDPAAASSLETEGIGRPEAEKVLQEVFGDGLEASAEFFDELEVEAFRSDFTALIAPPEPGSSAGLASSLLPLRTEDEGGNEELVDLDLEQADGHLEPDNPLVEVQIPSELGDGIDLPESGVKIELPSAASSRTASLVGDSSAFFPNVDTDTDFVASAAPTGLETYTQLRSPDAPTEQVFHLSLPAGDQLEPRPDGGAQVVGPDGEPVLVVRPPTAIDAAGQASPATLEVNGDSLVLSVSPDANALFPILVDPLFESYDWNNPQGTTAGWKTFSNAGFSASWMMAGPTAWSVEGATTPGNQGNIKYYVPRYWEDLQDVNRGIAPTSYIRNMKLWNFHYTIYINSPFRNHPYAWMGLWDGEHQTWISSYTRNASEGALNNSSWVYEMKNEANNDDVKHGGYGLATSETWNGSRRDAYAGNATVEVSDDDYPSWAEVDDQIPGWFSTKASKPIYYKVGDNGLGIYQLRFKYAAAEGGRGETITNQGCTGSAASPCPYSLNETKKTFAWNPAPMAQGEQNVWAYGVDPVGHWSPVAYIRVRVDREPPELGLSGPLTEQAGLGTKLLQYALTVGGKDGDEATATATTPVGTVGTGTGQLERPFGVATDNAGNIWIADTTNNRVVELDTNGTYVRQITTTPEGPFKEIRGITVAPDGNVWVAEKGNKRVIKFSATGQFISKFTNAAVEPFDVAVSSGGTVWVTDPTAQKVWQFKEDGTVIRTIDNHGNGALNGSDLPFGIALDEFGNAWIAMQASNRILEISPTGSPLFAFGSTGSATGQFNAPFDVAIAPSGNLFVSDGLNHRIQEFKPDGGFMRQLGTQGTASNQLDNPKNIAIAPGNRLLVADYNNKRIARWDHADRHVESGAVKTEVKVDGVSKDTYNPGCAAGKNCPISREWVMKADEYAAGTHKVDVIATDGVGLQTTKSLNVETHGDLQPPAVAVSGSMTEQASLGTTRPSYKLVVKATDTGTAEERKSGIVSTSITVDGKVVDSSAPGCPAEGCSITREWTLNSDSYAVGSHAVQVVAKDGAGLQTTKSLTINIARDTTAPVLAASSALYTAPQGWVEQKWYDYYANATDTNGYGVVSLELKIDGIVRKFGTQTCPAGGCSKAFSLTSSIDMSVYAGGAHPAELVATDGAGNVRKRIWTINVVPKGQVPATEAGDTLEALEAVSEEEIVAPQSPSEPFYPGPESESELKVDSSGFHTAGAPAETTLGQEPEEGFEIETADGVVEVTPAGVDPAASPIESSSDISAISSNTGKTVDTIYRPIYDGAMTFQSIRTPTGTDEFSWIVNLRPGQYMEKVDARTVQVISSVLQSPVFTITAIEAHDAVGSTVPTTLSASGSTITLKVLHKAGNPAAGNAPFVYPVIAGSGWEGGIIVHQVVGPPPTESGNPETMAYYETEMGPPEIVPASEADGGASASSVSPERRRKFVRSVCGHSMEWVETQEGGEAIAEHKLERLCGNAFDPINHPGVAVLWRGSMRGAFFYTPAVKVRHRGAIDCARHIGPAASRMKFYAIKDAYECHYGPKTSDENGGVHADAGHYLRAQAHWEFGQRSKCYGNQPSEECTPPDTCWEWMDRAVELHLWPSGNIDPIKLLVKPPPGNC